MTLDEVCADIVRQWPEWEGEALNDAQVEQDSAAGVAVLVAKLKAAITPLLESSRCGCAQFVQVQCVCQGAKIARQIKEGKADAQS
jgi:hypothetical protein